MNNSNANKKERYRKAFSKYGIIPLLTLLKEYEDSGEYEECVLIRDAIQEHLDRINSVNSSLDDFDVPRHISEVDPSQEGFEFANEENYKNNVKHYVRFIKDMVEKPN